MTLRQHQPVSRADLAELTGLGRSTITAVVNTLMDIGLVREIGEAESSGGRRPVLLELVERARLVLAIRLTPRTVTLGLVGLDGRVIFRQRRGLRARTHQVDEVLEQVSDWAEEMLKETGTAQKILGAGLVLPGRVEQAAGRVESPELRWEDAEAGPWLQNRLGLPVLADGEANAFIRGESMHGAASGCRDAIGATMGASIGAGLLLDGQVYRGPRAEAGAIGHVRVDAKGPLCSCGAHGCLEAVAADAALVAAASAALASGTPSLMTEMVEGQLSALTREVIVAAAQDGDSLARSLLMSAGQQVGAVLGALATALGVRTVVVGGEAVEQAGPLLLDPLFGTLRASLPAWVGPHADLRRATLGENAWLTGAASLVLDRVFAPPTESGEFSLAAWQPGPRGE